MEIKYLKELELNPTLRNQTIKPIPESEISELEQLYNDGKEFPLALRELLFLAGSDCYVLEYGIDDTQRKMQEFVRKKLEKRNKHIGQPFFVIDTYNGNEMFLFVYLTNGEDPAVYEALYYEKDDWHYQICPNLSTYISNLIERVKEGRNPF